MVLSFISQFVKMTKATLAAAGIDSTSYSGQFQDRRCHNGVCIWSRKFTHTNFGPLEERSVPHMYESQEKDWQIYPQF